jgi:hypothetical protein
MGKPIVTVTTSDPVDPAEILQTITDATSQDPVRLKASEEKMKHYADRPGTWDAAHFIAASPELPLEVRKMALILFKNGCLTRWKNRRYIRLAISFTSS